MKHYTRGSEVRQSRKARLDAGAQRRRPAGVSARSKRARINPSGNQPPSSCSTCNGVLFCTCHEAQVCRRSCHRNDSMPTSFSARRQARVLALSIGRPCQVNTRLSCLPASCLDTSTASLFSGAPIGFLALAWSGWIYAMRRIRSTCNHSNRVSFFSRSPVAEAHQRGLVGRQHAQQPLSFLTFQPTDPAHRIGL